MKLLFVLSEYLPQSGGGIISYYAGVLPYLVRAGHDVQVLVASPDSLDLADRVIDGVRISYLKSESLRDFSGRFERFRHGYPSFSAFLPAAWAAHRQMAGGRGYDLVETTDFPMLYAPWITETAMAPVNISLHGSPGQLDWYDSPESATLDSDLLRLVERAAFSSAFSVQANSEANARFWQHLTHRPIPVHLPSFSPVVQSGTCSGDRRTGSGIVVGRLQRWKGPHVLCRALESLAGVTVRWIGKDVTDPLTGMPLSVTLAAEYPEIFGKCALFQKAMPREQVYNEIANADFLCAPSTWDVFNLTVVEAMGFGTPVICSTEAGASMLIRHGENGYLFDPERPEQLAEAIRMLRALGPVEREELTAAARRTVSERLNPESLVLERIQFYESLTGSPAPHARDEWLGSLISPRDANGEGSRMLDSFTSVELLRGFARQSKNGIRRRIERKKR